MRLAFAGWVASLVLPQPNNVVDTFATQPLAQPVVTVASLPTTLSAPSSNSALLQEGVSLWLSADSNSGPSQADLALLRSAFAEFYGVNRNLEQSLDLLTQAIEAWQSQPPEERAGLYRVRGDCYTLLAKAEAAAADYSQAINLIQGPGGSSADPEELPAALLGRARARKAQLATGNPAGQQQLAQDGAADYRNALELTGRQEDWDTPEELLEDGIRRNPYAAWEWAAVLRQTGDWNQAARTHSQAADAFEDIGDKAHAVISLLDAGIDLAAAGETNKAVSILERAIAQTKGIENRDYTLLQRVITKESEGRMALAAILWNKGDRSEAEKSLGTACVRMDQLQDAASKMAAVKKDTTTATSPPKLLYNIDDEPVFPLLDCSDFRKTAFLKERLGWPEQLQQKMVKLEKLQVN